MRIKLGLLVTTVCAGILAMQGSAQAVPYAYASNQYTNLRLQMMVGGTPGAIALSGNPTETISANSQYQGYAPASSQNTQNIPIYPQTGTLDISQAFSGTGTIPGENTFGQAGPGTFIGTRADANIGGADNTGAITANNVAEGNGTQLGNSGANNNATIVFSITVTDPGSQILLTFNNIATLIAQTSAVGESATASVTNTFSISQGGLGGLSYSYAPSEINGQLSSQDGVPPNNSGTTGPLGFNGHYLSPVLALGTWNISITSASAETIHAVPEPASLALLGAGLVGLGLMRRRRTS